MTLQIIEPELFAVTESTLTVSFDVADAAGSVDAEAAVLVNGTIRATAAGAQGTRLVRVEGLEPGSSQRVELRARHAGDVGLDDQYGEASPEFPAALEGDTEVPYWQFMNEDAVQDINARGVDAVFIKGDIADRGRPEQFAVARETFAGFDAPHLAFLVNHDYYGLHDGIEVDAEDKGDARGMVPA